MKALAWVLAVCFGWMDRLFDMIDEVTAERDKMRAAKRRARKGVQIWCQSCDAPLLIRGVVQSASTYDPNKHSLTVNCPECQTANEVIL